MLVSDMKMFAGAGNNKRGRVRQIPSAHGKTKKELKEFVKR